MQGVHLRKYGVEATIDFEVYEIDGVDLRVDWVPAAADCEVMKDGGASTQCTNTATDEGSTYSIILTATEMQAARLVLKMVDAATKVFLDKTVVIETYGNASAMHAFDLDVATQGVDLVLISGDSTAADNLELQYDGTGLTGDDFPSKQSQLSGLANVGSAVNRPAASFTLTTGSEDTNTYTSTEALDGTRHELSDTAGTFEGYYEFNIGSGSPSSVQVTGYITGPNDDLDVYGYDWVATAWVQIGNIQGTPSTSNQVNSFDMFVDMVGSGSDFGKVRVRLYKASGLTSAVLAIDQTFVAFNQGVSGYEGGAIWIDTSLSNTNTVVGVDGTATNPVSTVAAANTLAAATNLKIFQIAPNSTVTLAATQNDQVFRGSHWTLALGGQDAGGSSFIGATVSGTGVGASSIDFKNCVFGTATLNPFHASHCGFTDIVTFAAAGDYFIEIGHSEVAGATTPILDTGAAVGNVNLSMPGWSNGVEIRNLNNNGTDLFSISGVGQIIYASSSSGAVSQRGDWKVTNTGGVTITEDDNTANLSTVLSDTADMQPKLGTPSGADMSADIAAIPTTAMRGTDSANTVTPDAAGVVPALLPAALVSGRIDANVSAIDNDSGAPVTQAKATNSLLNGVAATGTLSTTEMTTDLTVSVVDQFNGRNIAFADDTITAALRGQATGITATVVSGGKLTFTALTTAPVNGDTFTIF